MTKLTSVTSPVTAVPAECKECRSCMQTLSNVLFDYKSGQPRKGLQSQCKPCKLGVLTDHRRKMRALVNRWKVMKGCSECGFKGHHFQLDLDHTDPYTKENKGNHRAYEPSWSKAKIKNELRKCVILCANCHRLKTYTNGDHLP